MPYPFDQMGQAQDIGVAQARLAAQKALPQCCHRRWIEAGSADRRASEASAVSNLSIALTASLTWRFNQADRDQ